jgi:hypothetical protein
LKKKTIRTGGKYTPGLRFQGELMRCIMCGKQQRSNPKKESDWTCIEQDGRFYYICPKELAAAHQGKEKYDRAYQRFMLKIQLLRIEEDA